MQQQIISDINFFIKENISLSDKNWFKTGGSARYFCEPEDISQLMFALDFSQKKNLDIFFLGQGANILISDNGFDGIVIKSNLKFINILENALDNYIYLKVGSGATIDQLINYCLNNNIVGLEEFSGIPGTVGGAVFINIHYFEHLFSDFIIEAEIINKDGKIFNVDKSWFNFGYNYSKLQENYYLVSVTFKLKKANDLQINYAKGRSAEIIRHRNRRYPKENTCGSFFRNFFEYELNNNKYIYIAYYLDKLSIKGELSHGGAIVSEKHANMIVNYNNATSTDIIELAKKMQVLVYNKFKLLPKTECCLIGFKNYPLLDK